MNATEFPRELPCGVVLGTVAMAESVTMEASRFAQAYYRDAEAADFCGDDVETFAIPSWVGSVEKLVPAEALAKVGLHWDGKVSENELVATLGVDQHIDDAYGPVLCIVVHNDGLTFKTRRVSHRPKAGDWFVFDDRVKHGVKEASGASVFVALTLPLKQLR